MKNKVFAFIFAICFLVFSLLQVIDYACFDRGFYARIYAENQTSKQIGISDADLNRMTDQLLGYLKGTYDNLNVTVEVDGVSLQGFNQRECDHMVDVKALYQAVMVIKNICLFIMLVVILFAIASHVKQFFMVLFNGYLKAMALFLTVIGAIGTYAIMDFNRFWNDFHHVFFTNDLWLLNPETDRLIMMVPSNFFYALVLKILIITIILWVFMGIVLYYLKRRTLKNA